MPLHDRRVSGSAGRVETASRSSICTNRPDSGRLDHSAFAVTWNSTTLPLPQAAARDQRRAIGQRRDGALRQKRIGLRHDLAFDGHVLGDRQPIERGAFREGLSALGSPQDMAPPTVLPPTRRRTGISGPAAVACHVGGREPRTGEAHQKATTLHPVDQRRFLVWRERRHIGKDKGVGTGQQHVRQRALHQVRRGRERLPKVMQRRQQRLPLVDPPGRRSARPRGVAARHRSASRHRPTVRPRSRTG
jgi:hypothetical protein